MGIRAKRGIERQLRVLFNLGTVGELTDGQLLERFATRGGEAAELAFAALVERHGAMVFCAFAGTRSAIHMMPKRRFQAAFLILVKQCEGSGLATRSGRGCTGLPTGLP